MKRGPKDRRARDEAGIVPEEQPVEEELEEARNARRKDAEDTEWTSMVAGDPALFIKDPE